MRKKDRREETQIVRKRKKTDKMIDVKTDKKAIFSSHV